MFTYAVYANLIFHSTENQNYSPIYNLKKHNHNLWLESAGKAAHATENNPSNATVAIMTLCACA